MFGAEEGGESTPADSQQAAARRKQLVFELNKNGQYLRLKEQLKAAVIGIVKDSYHKSGGMGREEMQASLCLASISSAVSIQETTCWSMSYVSTCVLQIRSHLASCALHSVYKMTLHNENLFTGWSPFCHTLLQVMHLCNKAYMVSCACRSCTTSCTCI